MGIYIKGMEMPKDCRECKMLTYYSTSGCSMCDISGNALARNFKPIPFDGRPDWCPLVEIPEPHGRLIDGDALQCKVDDIGLGYYEVLGVTEDTIEMAPTVIERVRTNA